MLLDPPYPADTRAKGWRFELDHERIRQSDTWSLAPADVRPWLLMLWMVAWEQTPCGSLPSDPALIAAKIGMTPRAFGKHREVLMRGWKEAIDGRLYHSVLTERVLELLGYREATAKRKAQWRARTQESRSSPDAVPKESRRSHTPVPRYSRVTDATGTGTGTGTGLRKREIPSEAIASGTSVPSGSPPEDADTIFALGVPLLTAAGVSDRNARSMLGLQRKQHGDVAVVEALQRCAVEKPLQPVAWLQAALKAETKSKTRGNRQLAIEAENRRVAEQWLREGVQS